jgi:hypothetical protein
MGSANPLIVSREEAIEEAAKSNDWMNAEFEDEAELAED